MQCVLAGDVQGAKESLATGANPNRIEKHPRGATPLTIAARSDNVEMVRTLLDGGANPNQPDSGENPLMAAVVGQDVDVVNLLLQRGADPNQPNPMYVGRDGEVDDSIETPLTFAKSMGYRQIEQILREAGAAMPAPTKTELAAGVHWWDDWDQVVARADVPTVADALARLIRGRVVRANWGDTLTPGERSFVVVRARGLNWTNLLPVTPNALGHERYDLDTLKQLAEELANETGAETIWACYGDTAGAAGWSRFQPDGRSDEDDGWDEDLLADVVEAMEEAGEDVPEHMARRLAEMQDADEPGPDSTERLKQLAEAERFALAWEFFNVREGDDFDLEFAGYPAEAFEDVAFVTT
ncbi:MAG: ankyrin repeat domain-containing protein [Pirellulales bacterium]